jgi:hypothetical protein
MFGDIDDLHGLSCGFRLFGGTKWQIETVDSQGDVGHFTSLSHGPSGHPAISYFDTTNQDLKFAAFDGATWVTTTVDSKGNVGTLTSLSHGPAGHPAISYRDETSKNLIGAVAVRDAGLSPGAEGQRGGIAHAAGTVDGAS